MVQGTLKIVLHGKFILFYENPFEGDYIVLLIKHKHGFLVQRYGMIRDKNSENPINAGQKSLVETVSSNLFVPIQPTIDCCYIFNAGTKITKEAD